MADQITVKSAELCIEARDQVYQEKGVQSLVAGSTGPYSAFLEGGFTFSGLHAFEVEEDQFYEYHRPRFEIHADQTEVDFLAIETIPCSREVSAILKLLPTRPGVKAMLSMVCNSGSTLSSGEKIADVVKMIEERDELGQIEAIGVNGYQFPIVTFIFGL